MPQAAEKPATADRVTVLIVEDDAAARERFVKAISSADNEFDVVVFDTAGGALRWLQEHEPAVLLCDLGLPDAPGTDVITYCAHRYPRCDSMVITLYEDADHVYKSLEAGASGYLLKDSVRDEIVEHVRVLRAGGAPMTPLIARLVLKRFRQGVLPVAEPVVAKADGAEQVVLTPREQTILQRIAQGFSYAEIADLEHVSRHTVHSHIKRIYSKLSVHSRSEAVFEANTLGLIRLG